MLAEKRKPQAHVTAANIVCISKTTVALCFGILQISLAGYHLWNSKERRISRAGISSEAFLLPTWLIREYSWRKGLNYPYTEQM